MYPPTELSQVKSRDSPVRLLSPGRCTPNRVQSSQCESQWVFRILWRVHKYRNLQRWKILKCLFCMQLCGGGGIGRDGTSACTW